MSTANPVSDKSSGLQTYFRLFKYFRSLIIPFIVSIIGFAAFAASQPMLAKLMEMVIEAINAKDVAARWTLPLMAIVIFIFRGIGSFFGSYYNAYVGGRLITNIRIDMFNHLTTLPAQYYSTHSNGEIFQRVTSSVNLISQAFTGALKVMIREGLTIVFLLVYIFYLNWRLSLTFLAIAPFLLLTIRYTTKRFRSLTKKSESIGANMIQTVSEVISGYEIMRIFGGESYEKQRHEQAVNASFNNTMKSTKLASLSTPVIQLLVAASLAAIIFLLLQPQTLANNSAGELIGYLTAVALLPKSMKQLSGLGVVFQRGIIGAELIFELLDTKSELDHGTHENQRVKGRIAVNSVSFRYNKEQDIVLDNISFDIVPGEMVALVGKSGSGKSTLAALLQRFYDVDSGVISIDGVDIRDYKLANLRKQIALVSQNLVLFNDTIRNNIAYGNMRGASDAQVLDAARRAHATEFIEKLPQGLDTLIGDKGLQLSGGQRQRIAIARAFLKDAPILILDEATSALDNQSEQYIQEALSDIMQGRTTIVIAHRLSTIEKADTILVMSQGKILEQGSHQTLLDKKGLYASLYLKEFDANAQA
jgi:subfamily B ATP-binding cassette protein MsbA